MLDATIEQAANGEREAMAKLVAEHYPAVFRFCARRLGPELAKDAAQETFLTAQSRLRHFDERSTFLTWLLGIAHNHCRNLARKRKTEIVYVAMWQPPGQPGEGNLIDRHTLKSALLTLSVEHREAVVMHEIEGLSYDEIASILQIPSGTVKSRLHHAFLQLRQRLSPEQVPA
jgi:RNA polymerase sigma-70 factor (ECF subfamily)